MSHFFENGSYEWAYQEEFLNKTDAFSERLQQRLINKRNI